MILERAKEHFASARAMGAIEFLMECDDEREVMEAFNVLVMDAYWEHKDIEGVILLAQTGIAFSLERAESPGDEDQNEEREQAWKSVKVLTYNLASFCWPGWDEP